MFSRDPLQRSNMFSNDKTDINTGHIVYCTDQFSRKKKQQNLSKFEVAIRIACAGCRSVIYMSNGGSGVKILETHVEPRTTAKST